MPPHQTPGHQNLLRRVCTTMAVAMAVVLLCLLLWYGIYVFLLIFASVLLAIFLYGVSYWVSTHTSLSYGWALTLVAMACIAIIGGSLWWAGAALGEQVDELVVRLPRALQKLQQRLEQYEWARNLIAELPEAGKEITEKADVVAKAPRVLFDVFSALGASIILLAVGLYLALDPYVYMQGLLRLVPVSRRSRVQDVLFEVRDTLGHWLLGRMVSMLIVGVVTTLGLWLIGVPLALALGLLAALAEFVPNLGPLLAFAPAILLALTESTTQALAVLLLYLGVQGFESYVLTPLVEKRAVSLPPALTIFSQVLLGVLAGGMGLALATPLAAASLVLVQRFYVEDTLGDSLEVPPSSVSPDRAPG